MLVWLEGRWRIILNVVARGRSGDLDPGHLNIVRIRKLNKIFAASDRRSASVYFSLAPPSCSNIFPLYFLFFSLQLATTRYNHSHVAGLSSILATDRKYKICRPSLDPSLPSLLTPLALPVSSTQLRRLTLQLPHSTENDCKSCDY